MATFVISNLHFSYGENPLFRGINYTIPESQFTVILGRNGSGKSTLLRLMTGYIKQTDGEIFYEGKAISSFPLPVRAQKIGYLPQLHKPVFPFSVEDVVMTGRSPYIRTVPRKNDREKTMSALETVGIRHLKDRPYTELSGGERQLVLIARVIAQEPQVILFDEPTAHLDFANQARILTMVKSLTSLKFTVLAALHDPNAAIMTADHVVLLQDGIIYTLPVGENSWDAERIAQLYDIGIVTVPFKENSLFIPEYQ